MDNHEMHYTYPEIEEIILNYRSVDAVKLLISLLKSDKNQIEEIFEKAMIYYYIDSDLKNTLKELDDLLEINPAHIEALLLKGQILAGIHKYDDAIETLNNIHPKILPYGYKKLIEYITEYNYKDTFFYRVFDFYSHWEYVYIESDLFKIIKNNSFDDLEDKVLDNGLIWHYLDCDLTEDILGSGVSDEEPVINLNNAKYGENCIICGKKLTTNETNLCKTCLLLYDLEDNVYGNDPIWDDFDRDLTEDVPIISGSRLSDEEPTIVADKVKDSENCIVCGKKLKANEKNLCKSCQKKQYASKIIKKLVSVVQPGISFKKSDLSSLNLDEIQIKDYIWTLQEFDLIDVDNSKFKLKDKNTLNDFRIESKMEPIDFDSLEEENKLNKTCQICGKTLPISQFYKSSEEYGDVCKVCKKLTVTAKYLEDIINYVGFDNEFDVDELTEYVPNESQIMGMIWSLQDNDLLMEKECKTYVLVDKSKCLEFLDKYDPQYELQETNIKVKSKSKSKVREGSAKSKIEDDVVVSVDSKKDLKLVNDKKEQMKIVLKARKDGKSREEAADIAGIPYYKINHWYKEGKQGFGKDNISFYKRLKKIENNLSESLDLNERKQMNFVLKLLRQGKSKEEIAKLTEINKSTIATWYNQGKEKYSKNTIYFFTEVQKIEEVNKNKTIVNDLKVQIKEFIPKFMELDDKIAGVGVISYELGSLRNDIESNIEILKASSRLRRIDKLEDRLSNAERSYKELNNKVNAEFINIKNKNRGNTELINKNKNFDKILISENANRIINLRNEFSNNSSVFDELSEISLLNSKYNSNLKNGKDSQFDEIFDLKERLDNIESNLKSADSDSSIPAKKDNVESSTENSNNFSNIKEGSNKQDLLEFLYSITGRNEISLKVSFIYDLSFNRLSVRDGKGIREEIKNEIDEGILKSSNDVRLRLDELIKERQLDDSDKLLEFLYSITGRYEINPSFWTKFSVERLLSESDVKIIRNRVVDEIRSEKLKSNEDIELRIEELTLLKYVNSINCQDEGIAIVECNKIKDKLRAEINLDKLYTIEQVNSRFNELVKQKASDSHVLIDYCYSIIGRNEIKYSFYKKFLTYNLDDSDVKEIREIVLEEIKSFKLKSRKEINLRINQLINQNKKVKCNGLLEELYMIVGKNNLSNSFLRRLSDKWLNVDSGIYIKSAVEDKIKNFSIKNKLEINEEINRLINEELIRQNKSINKLNELFINDNIYLRGLSSSEREEIKGIVKKSIQENRLDYLSVYPEFKKSIEEFKKTKNVDDFKDSKNEDSNENNESKSSGGLISKLKRFFSFK